MTAKKYVICDIEATGLDADREPIEIALITWKDDTIIDVYETLVNPLRPIPEFISNLTSITNRELQKAPKFYEVAEAIRMRLEGAVFVSHNTEFDLGLIRKKYQEMGQELKVKNFCTLKVAQHEIPGLLNYNLDALCSFFGIKISSRHTAIGDAMATLELFKELMQLRTKNYPKILFLPHHEKILKKIPNKAGLIYFKNSKDKILRVESSFNIQETARNHLMIKDENRKLLLSTSDVSYEVTGSALIGEFKKLLASPYEPHWVIFVSEMSTGEMMFKISPYKKEIKGLWFFRDFFDARHKLRELETELKKENFIYREGGISKEEILKHNQKVEKMSKESRFPTDHLVIIGEGRKLGERSVILVRNNHVLGYGYTTESQEDIFSRPDQFIQIRFVKQLSVDIAAKRYIRILKNLRQKNESWKSLPDLGY